MRAVIRHIDLGDDRDWKEVVSQKPDPWKAAERFFINIGSDDSEGGEWFQVWVATPAAKHLAVERDGEFRGVLVDHFDQASILQGLKEHIEIVEADTWFGIVKKLRPCWASWEFEYLNPLD